MTRELQWRVYSRLFNLSQTRYTIKPDNFTTKQWADYKATTATILDTIDLLGYEEEATL